MTEYGMAIRVNTENIVSNLFCKPKRHAINTIGLIMKQFLYQQRCLGKQPSFPVFRKYIQKYKNIEKYIATKNGKIATYYNKWENRVAGQINRNEQVEELEQFTTHYLQEM